MQSLINELEKICFTAKEKTLFNKIHNALNKLDQFEKDDKRILTGISQKMNLVFKTLGSDIGFKELALERAKILDHFTLAYLAETGLRPSEINMVQNQTLDGLEIYFEKRSSLILSGE